MKNVYNSTVLKYARSMVIYRMNIISNIVSEMILLFVQASIWQTLFKQGKHLGTTLSEAMTYMVIATVFLKSLQVFPGQSISKSVYNGDIELEFYKPISLVLFYTSQEIGKSIFQFVLTGIPMFIISILFFGVLPPKDTVYFFFFLLTSFLGFIILILFDCILGYSAFWVMNNWYIPRIESALIILFGGSTIPLWFYPQWLLKVCNILPFRYMTFDVINIYLGRVSIGAIFNILLMQLFWIVLLLFFERLIWMRAKKKITIQGG